ncbi:sigma-54-dependent transcriptional regulator [Bacteroides reticulotermitis]|uniref:sigma-54-dependent transcriptional regulator n=1 Tax=Bacteroides reticulotermitis TaxID=1133319 RepID=UPI003A89E2CC
MKTVLVVEDERTYARIIANWLIKNGMNARYVLSINAAKEFVPGQKIDLILSDFNLPGGNCMELFSWMRANGYRIPFLIMTGFGNIEKAVDAIKRGVDNYLIKPIQSEKVLNIIDDLLIESEKTSKSPFVYYYGKSPLALKTQEYIRIAAPVESLTILLRGESGTGKEYAARQIYAMSKRSNAPFIAVDCGTLPKELAASELFGYIKGAFTGATENKTGLLAAANHGTLFLDEIGNLGLDVQRLMLRFLQEKKYRPVGGKEEVKADIRLLAATNENLEKAIAEGRFREDFFHRLNEFPIYIPSLAECPEDILPLAEFFLRLANKEFEKDIKGFDCEVQQIFKKYAWTGNLRELRSVIRRAVLLAKSEWITSGELIIQMDDKPTESKPLDNERMMREAIVKMLVVTGNNKRKAAKLLGIARSTLYARMKKYHIK